jgi:hypothetical protein
MKHDGWYELEVPPSDLMRASKMSNSSMGQVHLIIKWIFCRQKYLETGIKRLDEALRDEEAELEGIRDHLKSFILPFSNLKVEEEEKPEPSTKTLTFLAEGGDPFAKVIIQEKYLASKVDQVA